MGGLLAAVALQGPQQQGRQIQLAGVGCGLVGLVPQRSQQAAQSASDAMGGALVSLLTNDRGPCLILDGSHVPMENNLCERTLLGPVISGYLVFRSGGPNGAKTARLLLGFLETVRLAGLYVNMWEHDWLEARTLNRSHSPTDLRPWLPWEMSAGCEQKLNASPRWSGPAKTLNPSVAETRHDPGTAKVVLLAA